MPTVRVDYSPVHELATSLFAYTDNKNQMHDLGKTWRDEVQPRVSGPLADKLQSLDLWQVLGYLHLVIVDSPEKTDVNRFLAWFAELGEGQLYEMLAPYLEDGFPMGMKAFRDDCLEVLTEWHRIHPIQPHIHELLSQSAAQMDRLRGRLPFTELLDTATNGIIVEESDTYNAVLLIPTYHIKPLNRMDVLGSQLIISYAVDLDPQEDDTPPSQLLRMTKGLADEKRLILLHILAKGPISFSELQQRTGLSKSNLHYHLSLLKTAGLLRLHFEPTNEKYTYSARPQSLDQLKSLLQAYVFGPNKQGDT